MRQHRIFYFFIFFIILTGFLSPTSKLASAQTEDENWTTPINLSTSGATTDPYIAVDSNNFIHAIWTDRQLGFMYSFNKGEGWSDPGKTNMPFRFSTAAGSVRVAPHFAAIKNGRIIALWREGLRLKYSTLTPNTAGKTISFTNGQVLASSVLSFDMYFDEKGIGHVAFLQPENKSSFPAGIYYSRSQNNGASWSRPVILYSSSYYRNLVSPQATDEQARAQSNLANSISINVGYDDEGKEKIYIGYDNQPRKRILLSTSQDNGKTWNDPLEIDRPTSEGSIDGPFGIKVSVQGKKAVLAWQSGTIGDTQGGTCTHYYQTSEDGGITWSDSQRMMPSLLECSEDTQFINGVKDYFVLLTTISDQVYLTAWDGKSWSNAQPQSSLYKFIDQDTFVNVDFRCRQFAKTSTNNLYAVGCDEGSGQDIWFSSLSLNQVKNWFPGNDTWKVTESIYTSLNEPSDLQLLADNQNRLHAIWTQLAEVEETPEESSTITPYRVIYYSYMKDTSWSKPQVILGAPSQDIVQPFMVLGTNGKLVIVGRASETGEVFQGWADTSKASSIMEWSPPSVLPSLRSQTDSPVVAAAPNGNQVVAYTIPINEDRGVYVSRTDNLGLTWSEPVKIFDGMTGNWESVSKPYLAISSNSALHIQWLKDSYSNRSTGKGLYYSRSADDGVNWAENKEVTQNPVTWSKLITDGDLVIHRLWREQFKDQTAVFHQYSQDGGGTWGKIIRILDNKGTTGSIDVVKDNSGKLHLIDLHLDENHLILKYWFWGNERWGLVDQKDLGRLTLPNHNLVSSAITEKGLLTVLGSKLGINLDSRESEAEIFYTNRVVKIEPIPTMNAPTAAPLAFTPIPSQTPVPQPTPTLNLSELGPVREGGNTLMTGLVIGGITFVLVIFGIVAYSLYSKRVS